MPRNGHSLRLEEYNGKRNHRGIKLVGKTPQDRDLGASAVRDPKGGNRC